MWDIIFHSLLITRCKITCYSLQKLVIAKYRSLLVAKFAHYLLQKLFVTKNHLLLVAKFARYSLQKLFVAKNHLTPTKKLNKDTIEISVIYILSISYVPIESHTLNALTACTETKQVTVIKKLIDWFLYKYKNLEIQWIHQ